MLQRFSEFKLQPSNAVSNMVITLRPTPGNLNRMLLIDFIKLSLEAVSAVLPWAISSAVLRLVFIPISPSSSPCLNLNPQSSLQMYTSSS